MKKRLLAACTGLSLFLAPAAYAAESIDSDPASDADCLIALLALSEEADSSDQDAVLTMAIYYFGRLGGEGQANSAFIISRMGRFADDETLILTEAESCITDFETESNKFDELSKLLD